MAWAMQDGCLFASDLDEYEYFHRYDREVDEDPYEPEWDEEEDESEAA